MASRSPRRTPRRTRVREEAPIEESPSRSPSRARAPRTLSKLKVPVSKLHSAVDELADVNPRHMLGLVQRFAMIIVASSIITGLAMRFELISKYVCPIVEKVYLEPLGWHQLKTKGQIYLGLAFQFAITFFVLPVLVNLSIPLCHGIAVDLLNPRQQRANLTGPASRLSAAQLNSVEGLVLLVGSVMSALQAGVSEKIICEVVSFYVVVRKVYVVSYAMDCAMSRTIAYMSGAMACMYLFYLSITSSLPLSKF